MACVSNYVTVTSTPTVSGDAAAFIGLADGWITSVQQQWESNLRKLPTLNGNKAIPDIAKGQTLITVLVPPTGYPSGNALTSMSLTDSCELCINGYKWTDTYYTGGQLGTQEFGEGLKTLRITKRFTIFGICPTAT